MRRLKHPNCDEGPLARAEKAAAAMRRALADRRGATATFFAASLIVVLGFVGLGTEVGSWYLGRRVLQNAADAAAIAGAFASFNGADPSVAAVNAVSQNGFAAGGNATVSVTTGTPITVTTATGSQAVVPTAVTVSEPVPPLLSSLFAYTGTTVGATAQAVVEPVGKACVLALSGQLSISASVEFACSIGSDLASPSAVNVTGSLEPTSGTATVFSVGGCAGCGGLDLASGNRPPQLYHPAVADPYATQVATVAVPTFGAANCTAIPAPSVLAPDGSENTDAGYVGAKTIWLWPYELNGHMAYCNAAGSLVVTSSITPVKVKSGTYFFNNASISIDSGVFTCMSCSTTAGTLGANFVFTGDTNIGAITIANTAGTAKVSLVALTNNTSFPGLNGLLFYGTGIQQASIYASNGGSAATRSTLAGGIYFPNATVNYSGNQNSTCITVVAAAVSLDPSAGSAYFPIDSVCKGNFATALATVYGARLVQ
jgi:Flp pilus assembly protein TadG